MLGYLAIATVIGIVLAIIGGALLSVAEFKEFIKPLAYTLLWLGFGMTIVLAIIWMNRLIIV